MSSLRKHDKLITDTTIQGVVYDVEKCHKNK